MPKSVYITRIILRFLRKTGNRKKKERISAVHSRLLKWTKTFQNRNFPEIRTILDRSGDKVIWLSSREEVDVVLQGV